MEYNKLILNQRKFVKSGKTKSIKYRKAMLIKLKKEIIKEEKNIIEALYKDLGRNRGESFLFEVVQTIEEIDYTVKKLAEWSKSKTVKAPLYLFPGKSKIIYEPYGSVLVITSWNFPFLIGISPLVGALAAGNACVLKPSEQAVHTSKILKRIINNVFPEEACTVIEGGKETSEALLKEEFDFIHYTGSSKVGKIVAQNAAEHLTPVILEMGGKNPCIVHKTADIKIAVKRILWGKFLNSGQSCVAPDYLVIDNQINEEFIKELRFQAEKIYSGKNKKHLIGFPIVNQHHFDRIISDTGLESIDKEQIVFGGRFNRNNLKIEPTIIAGVEWEDAIMENEIFGPILPIITYENFNQMLSIIRKRDTPLAMYLFANDKKIQRKVVKSMEFGGGCINSTLFHNGIFELPFGGKGISGIGSYHGKKGFENFSHQKSIYIKKNFEIPIHYPPYQWVEVVKKYYLGLKKHNN